MEEALHCLGSYGDVDEKKLDKILAFLILDMDKGMTMSSK